MATFQKTLRLSTKGHTDVIDLTSEVERIVAASGIREGVVNVSGLGSTLAVTTIEFEPGAVADLKNRSRLPIPTTRTTPAGATTTVTPICAAP